MAIPFHPIVNLPNLRSNWKTFFCIFTVFGLGMIRVSALTLDDAVKGALANNLDLRAAYFEVEKARGRLLQAGLWPNPRVEIAATTDRAFNNEGQGFNSAGFSQPFPIAGRLRFAKQVGLVDVAQAIAEIRNRERLLIGETQREFLTVLVLDQQIATRGDFLKINREFVQVVEKRLEKAEVSQADVTLASVEAQRLELEIETLQVSRAASELALKQRLGLPPDAPLTLAGDVMTLANRFSPEKYSDKIIPNRPDLRLTELGIDRAQAEIRLARAEAWGDWDVGFDFETDNAVDEPGGLNRDSFFGVKVAIPFPFWNRNQGRVQEQQAASAQSKGEVDALRLTIRTQIATALIRARKLREVVGSYQDRLLPAMTKTTDLLKNGYASGLTDATQVIQGQQQRALLLTSYLDVTNDYIQALVDLDTAAGASPFLKKEYLEIPDGRVRSGKTTAPSAQPNPRK